MGESFGFRGGAKLGWIPTLEDVMETLVQEVKAEEKVVVELSLAELAQVGGGLGAPSFV